ncbi:family S53 protease-like protein [Earliella scabrosa]|nr:family S53 protease-like protein [Earliella scabrosa]
MGRAALFVRCLVPIVFAIPSLGSRINTALGDFYPVRPATPESSIDLLLALPPSNIDGLHAVLKDISDPRSPNYGKYLSKSEVEVFVAPKQESVRAVKDWLARNNVSAKSVSPSGDLLRADISVKAANVLLDANYTEFLHSGTSSALVRTLSYTIPPAVQDHLSFIYPTTQFIPALSQTSSYKRSDMPDHCEQFITPQCLQALYSIPSTPATAQGNSIAVGGFLDDMATEADLLHFSDEFRPDISDPTFEIVSVENGKTDGDATLEASLDIDYTVGLATDVPVQFISVGNFRYDGLLDLTNHLLAQDRPPLVLTTSYDTDKPYSMICNAYAQLGARGTTVIFSSGDGGVTDPTVPSVTSVGGTQGISPEVAAPFSAGGFSNLFPRPSYQSAPVSAYLASARGAAHAGRYNASGRAYPDLALQAVRYVVSANGQFYALNGTSAAAPAFASVVALLNDRRLARGLPPLGFINPLLYGAAETQAFSDVTQGNNPGCGTDGFEAGVGWDPVCPLIVSARLRLRGSWI